MGCIQSQAEREREGSGEERERLVQEEDNDEYSTEDSSELTTGGRKAYSRPNGYMTEEEEGEGSGSEYVPSCSLPNKGKESELVDLAAGGLNGSEEKVEDGEIIKSHRGKEVLGELKKAYRWRDRFSEPSQEFLALMDRLYMECQLHMSTLASRGDVECRREADAIVSEMVSLRNHWGPQLLPNSTCNAFVRERISLTLGVEQRQFRIDCAQFFEPVPFYGSQNSSCPGELMKLYRFSVYNVARNEVVLRYYLERSNVAQFYHVLCFIDSSCHGQVKPYGTEAPSYWEMRQNLLEDLHLRLLSTVSPETHPVPRPLAVTVFSTD